LEWQVGGFAADPAAASASQLVQALAAFGGGGAAEGLTVSLVNADTPQQALITIPQHA
jgi:hypothetical protein